MEGHRATKRLSSTFHHRGCDLSQGKDMMEHVVTRLGTVPQSTLRIVIRQEHATMCNVRNHGWRAKRQHSAGK